MTKLDQPQAAETSRQLGEAYRRAIGHRSITQLPDTDLQTATAGP